MRLQELLEVEVIGSKDFNYITPGKLLGHGLLGVVTVVRWEGNSIVVKTPQGNLAKVAPSSLNVNTVADLGEDAQLNEYVKKVNGKWALVSKTTGKPLQYYHGNGYPSKEWISKVERRVHSFSKG